MRQMNEVGKHQSVVVLGFDPGGLHNFGWASLVVVGETMELQTGVVSDAPSAISKASSQLLGVPDAIGIDAPLFWISKGDRLADQIVRARIIEAGGRSSTVNSVNSLRGACLVQGILTATFAHRLWPGALITESHLKALLHVDPSANEFLNQQGYADHPNEHERDAAVAAFSAWAAVTARSKWRNLAIQEQAPIYPSGNETAYWFPVSE